MTGPLRWLGYAALVVVFAVVCGLLSWWQFSRNAEAQERIRQVVDNWDAAPRAIGDYLDSPGTAFDLADTWSPVRLTGRYDAANQLLVRGRPLNGAVGFEVLVPLVLEGGGTVVVDRGWVPVGRDQAVVPDSVPSAPSGEVTVVARLKAGESSIAGRDAPAGQVATIDLRLVAADTGIADLYTGAYVLLASEDPAVATPTLTARPDPDPGPFLSYAVQWILFAVMAAVAFIWAFRNERRARAMTAEERQALRVARAERRRDADAAAEDALLDA